MKKLSFPAMLVLAFAVSFVTMLLSAFLLTRFSGNYQSSDTPVQTARPNREIAASKPKPTAITEPAPSDPPNEQEETAPVHILPANGEITKGFSVEELIYSESTGEWSTHTGIDISAPETEVRAASDGTVSAIEPDTRLGTCIVIDHTDGLQTLYYGCSEISVSLHDFVNAGDRIGTTGIPSPGEALDGVHLHFEVKKEGEFLDPQEFFG